MKRQVPVRVYVLAGILGVLFVFYVIAKLSYNRFVDRMHFLHIAHDSLDVELQRRHDLVKKTNTAAKEYINIEREIFLYLTTLNGLIEREENPILQKKLQGQIIALLNNLSLLVENYPKLKSVGPYMFLVKTVQESSHRVSIKRHEYNQKVYEYNMFCRLFPYNMFAKFYGYYNEPFFKAYNRARHIETIRHLLKADSSGT